MHLFHFTQPFSSCQALHTKRCSINDIFLYRSYTMCTCAQHAAWTVWFWFRHSLQIHMSMDWSAVFIYLFVCVFLTASSNLRKRSNNRQVEGHYLHFLDSKMNTNSQVMFVFKQHWTLTLDCLKCLFGFKKKKKRLLFLFKLNYMNLE